MEIAELVHLLFELVVLDVDLISDVVDGQHIGVHDGINGPPCPKPTRRAALLGGAHLCISEFRSFELLARKCSRTACAWPGMGELSLNFH